MRTTAKAKDTDLGRRHAGHWRFNGMWGFTPMISGVRNPAAFNLGVPMFLVIHRFFEVLPPNNGQIY